MTEQVLLHWTKPHSPLPEYAAAAKTICVEREWMADTMLLRHIRAVTAKHGAEVDAIRASGKKAFESALEAVLIKAYFQGNIAADKKKIRKQKDLLSKHRIWDKVTQVYTTLEGWKKPYFVHAWLTIVEHEKDVGAIVSKLSEVVDHSLHCPHVQVKSFQLVLSHCSRLVLAQDGEEQAGKKGQKVSASECHASSATFSH